MAWALPVIACGPSGSEPQRDVRSGPIGALPVGGTQGAGVAGSAAPATAGQAAGAPVAGTANPPATAGAAGADPSMMTGAASGGMMAADGTAGVQAGMMAAAGVEAGTDGATAGTMAAPVTGDICGRWTADRGDLSEGTWTGDTASCQVGDIPQQARDNALRLVNLYRFMAGLSAVEMNDENNRLAQGCALLMTANGMISHSPAQSWACYTQEAADTAASSSLSSGGSVSSVDGYMLDPGNPTTLGHRRWILSSMLAGIGFGSSGRFSCQYQPPVFRPTGGAPWVAWPPPGQVPIQVFGSRFYTIDQTGWSVQSDSVDLGAAQVTVTSDGADLPVSVTQLLPGYGSRYAIGFIPTGWTTEVGKTYSVSISGTSTPIAYDVEIVDCP